MTARKRAPRTGGAFAAALAAPRLDPANRRWLFVPYDQLSHAIGPLAREAPRDVGIVLVENPWKAARRPYHKQKLALVLANLRHFAREQAARGVAVRHVVARGPYRDALEPLAAELGPLRVMDPAERELREDLAPLVAAGGIEVVPHEGWLTTPEDFRASHPRGAPWRMDVFYRHVRRARKILTRGTKPVGGKWSFDAENRRPWSGDPPAAVPPRFVPDEITREVGALIEDRYAHHPGALDLASLPATAADARRLWTWAKRACLPRFGPFEDAMSTASTTLFHTRISALLNLHRILPRAVLRDALALDLPLASREGFVRQVLGWREFVRHVHRETDGFRRPPGRAAPAAVPAGAGEPDRGAAPSHLGADGPLPPAYWETQPSGMRCLDTVVADVWREGYSHHITRLMILANVAALLDVSPRAIADWFWVAYTDAYDWVVEPNVMAMGVYGVGDLMTTKPYVAGASYVRRMSDYCRGCAFDPATDCPLRRLYWAYLSRHASALRGNARMRVPLAAAARRDPSERRRDRAVFARVRETLAAGRPLLPEAFR